MGTGAYCGWGRPGVGHLWTKLAAARHAALDDRFRCKVGFILELSDRKTEGALDWSAPSVFLLAELLTSSAAARILLPLQCRSGGEGWEGSARKLSAA